MFKQLNVNWDKIDWNKANGDLADECDCHISTIRKIRKKKGLSNPQKGKVRKCLQVRQGDSKGGRPPKSIDYEYKRCRKYGRKKSKSEKCSGGWKEAVHYLSGPKCSICGYYNPLERNHCHHIIPLGGKGPNSARNGIIICKQCHEDIHNRFLRIPREKILYALELVDSYKRNDLYI